MTNDELALIEGVELALDCGYDLPEEHFKKYQELIKKRSNENEMQSK